MRWKSRFSKTEAVNILLFLGVTAVGSYALFREGRVTSASDEIKIGTILDKQGVVEMRTGRAQGWIPASVSSNVYDQSSIYTQAASSASVQLKGSVVQIEEKTLVQIRDPQQRPELFMDFGSLQFSSKTSDKVILNVGGERLELTLDGSAVKVTNDKKTGLKVVSLSGKSRVVSRSGKKLELEAGQALNLETPIRQIAEAVPSKDGSVDPKPDPEIIFSLKSSYVQDQTFSRRPSLKVTLNSKMSFWFFESSTDGIHWSQVGGDEMIPASPGFYQVRLRGRLSGHEKEVISKVTKWNLELPHFVLRQPADLPQEILLDPTKEDSRNFLADLKVAPVTMEFKTSEGKIQSKKMDGFFGASHWPLGAEAYRVESLKDSAFKLDPQFIRVRFHVVEPRPARKGKTLSLKEIRLRQYYYEAEVLEDQRALKIVNGKIDPACAVDCTVKVRYRSFENPSWASQGTEIFWKAPSAVPSRRIAAAPIEASSALKMDLITEKIRVKEPWVYEFGGGGNYLNMTTSSSLTNATTSGVSGPTIFLSAEKQNDHLNYKASLLSVGSKMQITSQGQSTTQDLSWRSFWAGVSTPGFWLFQRMEYGLSYQNIPFFYQDTSGVGQFDSASVVAATAGFNSIFEMGPKSALQWDQRLLVPLSSGVTNQATDFKSKFGVEGTISYFRCLENQWAVGASWLGQLTQASFNLPANGSLQADSLSSSMLNSNFQLRLQYGLCHFARR